MNYALRQSLRVVLCSLVLSLCTAAAAPRDLHGKDWSSKDLQNENLDRADLSDANLHSANLTNATLKGANLRQTDLRGARLKAADLNGADLRGALLGRADLDSAKFVKANLEGSEVFLAYGNTIDPDRNKRAQRLADEAGLASSGLTEHNGDLTFKEANLRNARLHGSMEGVDFRRADLRGADLSDTKDAAKAELRGAIYDGKTRWPAGFDLGEARVVRGDDAPAPGADAKTAAAPISWTGKWLIKAETSGLKEDGVLTIKKEGTYTWDYSMKADPIAGTWKQNASGIVITRGEAGHDWIATEQPHDGRSDSIQLRASDAATLQRWAVPLGAE
jgi:uncharacterized protein YjbI with pentapeptide repeats